MTESQKKLFDQDDILAMFAKPAKLPDIHLSEKIIILNINLNSENFTKEKLVNSPNPLFKRAYQYYKENNGVYPHYRDRCGAYLPCFMAVLMTYFNSLNYELKSLTRYNNNGHVARDGGVDYRFGYGMVNYKLTFEHNPNTIKKLFHINRDNYLCQITYNTLESSNIHDCCYMYFRYLEPKENIKELNIYNL